MEATMVKSRTQPPKDGTRRKSISPPPHMSPLRVVLLGKTGSGKSASANTILGRKGFKSCLSTKSVTETCSDQHTVVDGREITVIDTPGLFDTKKPTEELNDELEKCVEMSLPGPHAFLLVIRLDARYTKEERKAVKLIQKNFGEGVLKYTIVLFTHGDALEGEPVEGFLSSDPDFLSLIESVGVGYHVFDNKSKDSTQVRELKEKIEAMVKKNGGANYTSEMYKEVQIKKRVEEERRKAEEEKKKKQAEEDLEEKKKAKEEKRLRLEANVKAAEEKRKRFKAEEETAEVKRQSFEAAVVVAEEKRKKFETQETDAEENRQRFRKEEKNARMYTRAAVGLITGGVAAGVAVATAGVSIVATIALGLSVGAEALVGSAGVAVAAGTVGGVGGLAGLATVKYVRVAAAKKGEEALEFIPAKKAAAAAEKAAEAVEARENAAAGAAEAAGARANAAEAAKAAAVARANAAEAAKAEAVARANAAEAAAEAAAGRGGAVAAKVAREDRFDEKESEDDAN